MFSKAGRGVSSPNGWKLFLTIRPETNRQVGRRMVNIALFLFWLYQRAALHVGCRRYQCRAFDPMLIPTEILPSIDGRYISNSLAVPHLSYQRKYVLILYLGRSQPKKLRHTRERTGSTGRCEGGSRVVARWALHPSYFASVPLTLLVSMARE